VVSGIGKARTVRRYAHLDDFTAAALGITGTYATILARGRLALFGSHAVSHLGDRYKALVDRI
jgi:hypothetical protein